MWPNPHETADLVTFTEQILDGKLHFCAVNWDSISKKKFKLPNRNDGSQHLARKEENIFTSARV